ncbi:MAG: radical SAM protein [Candidatus Woesearchaeota archaeon]|nr:radical SAM protein [Candidatus Woesearchaeota archaeon]
MKLLNLKMDKIVLISTSTYPSDQGLRIVSSCLKSAGYITKIVFLPEEEDYSKKYSNKVLKQLEHICKDTMLIGIASYASTSIRAAQVINHLKKLDIPIVYGGIHATISLDLCIKESNIVCIGEGEEAIVELADAIRDKQNIEDIKNLWIKTNGKIIKNEIRPLIHDLNKLPFADYDIENHYILEKGKIVPFKEKHLNGQVFYQTIRGCPNSCTYCSNRYLKNLYLDKGPIIRKLDVNYVIKELLQLKNKFKTLGTIDFRAETLFIMSLDEVKDFCSKYKKYIGIRFKCLADPPTMNEEKLKFFIDAGLTDIIIGIQGCEAVNYGIYKRYIKDEQVIRAAKIVNKYKNKIAVMYDVITSNPYESEKDVLSLINLLIKLPKPYFLSVNNLVFFTGTELYEKAVKDGVIKSQKDSAFDLNYWDRFKHIKLKKRNAYLNLILNLMRGVVTEKRYGILPVSILKYLIREGNIKFNSKNLMFTYGTGYIVQSADFLREKIAKPIYRSMPTNFKVWYDKVRYRV